jgi:Ca2+/H+ antiporter, TMEM165/GDT1 family
MNGEQMKRRWVKRGVRRGVKIAVFGVVAVTLFGFLVRTLWNWLMPGLFGLHALTFWQALGLLALSWILFGGLRGGHRFGGGRHFREHWAEMTPEQREKVRAGMHGHRPDVGPPATADQKS